MTLSGYIWITAEGETFDSVALKLYGDERYACHLMQANPEMTGKLVFEADGRLYVPVVDVVNDNAPVTAPWK